MKRDRRRRRKTGFTLIELLVAIALMATILSMVYGSYAAVSGTAGAYRSRVETLQEGQRLLRQLQSLMEGCFTPETRPAPAPGAQALARASRPDTTEPPHFRGYSHADGSATIRCVTTGVVSGPRGQTDGLLYVTRVDYDPYRREVTLHQTPLSRGRVAVEGPEAEQILGSGVEALTLAYYDGQQWRAQWEDPGAERLPEALRIELTLVVGDDETPTQCGTLVRLPCARQPARETP